MGSLALRDMLPLPRENLLRLSAARPALAARYTPSGGGEAVWVARVDCGGQALARDVEAALVRYARDERGLEVRSVGRAFALVRSGAAAVLVLRRGGVLAAVRGRAGLGVLAQAAARLLP